MTVRPPSRLIASVAIAATMACAAPVAAAPAPPMTVALRQPSGAPLSYFQLQAQPGRAVSAGTLELRNRRARPVTVLLDPIAAVTATTLGSAYDLRGRKIRGPAAWTRVAQHRLVLAPRGTANVTVTVQPGRRTAPGDYLSGIGVQAVAQPQQTKVRRNVAISSTQRYAIGVEVRLPGPRHPLIRLTGASVKRDPAGIAFSVFGRNAGNVILQNVHGSALITHQRRVVARVAMGPGTFVTGTSIAYPVPTPREQPRQGTVYRVRAVLQYPGGVARLDTNVRFGRADALRQQAFGGPRAPGTHGGFPLLLVVTVIALALAALAGAFVWRARRPPLRSPLPLLSRALATAREHDEPLSLIIVAAEAGGADSSRLASVLRGRLRQADGLCRLDQSRFVVVAPDTDVDTAHALAADLQRHLTQATGEGVVEVHSADPEATAAEVLEHLTRTHSRAPQRVPH